MNHLFGSTESNSKSERKEISQFCDSINNNYYNFDTLKHEKILNQLLQVPDSESKWFKAKINYLIGLEYHILGKIYYVPNPEKADQYFQSSIEHLQLASANSSEKDPEILSLLSSSLGKKASFSTFSALYWGYKSRNRFYQAYELDSNNRKVLLIAAIHLMHLPSTYGGDKKLAKSMLKKCLKLKSKKLDHKVNWAADAEIYAYLAQLEILKNNKKEAENYIHKALKLEKNYDFVRIDLKKQLERL